MFLFVTQKNIEPCGHMCHYIMRSILSQKRLVVFSGFPVIRISLRRYVILQRGLCPREVRCPKL